MLIRLIALMLLCASASAQVPTLTGEARLRIPSTAGVRYMHLIALKANYGHYFATKYEDTAEDAVTLCEIPGVIGVNYRQTWKEVEPSAGVYNFAAFDEVLAAIAASSNPNCQLWIFIEFKSFINSPEPNPCPTYLQAAHSAKNFHSGVGADGIANTADDDGVYTCFMWDSVTKAAYIAMVQAAALRYDTNPRVEGIIFQESALGFSGAYSQDDNGSTKTYTPELFRTALVEFVTSCGTAWAQSRCMMFMNFLAGNMALMREVSTAISAVSGNRGCLGGPDILPNSTTLFANANSIYNVIVDHTGCRANSAQNNSYGVPGCDMTCIFNFAVRGTFGTFNDTPPVATNGGLCINSYLFWNHTTTPSDTGLTFENAKPVILANPYGVGWYGQCTNGGVAP